MKKISLLLLIFVSFQNTTSQNKYQLFIFEEIKNELVTTNVLYINPSRSLWVQNDETKIIESSKDESVLYKPSKKKNKYTLFKNLKELKIYHDYNLLGKKFYVKDSLSNMNWSLIDSAQVLLGYKCQIAKTKFRGRTYFASFTTEIEIQNGPWKFHGLPGMILKVSTKKRPDEEFYKMECIEINQHNIEIEESYQSFINKNNFITWQQLEKDFLRVMGNAFKKIKSKYRATNTELGEVTLKVKNKKEIISKKYQIHGVTKVID
jgi:GLPGLI family protein